MRIFGILAVLGSLLMLVGCQQEDKTLTAAPPPKADARPETNGGQPKAMPVNAPSNMEGPATKPAGM